MDSAAPAPTVRPYVLALPPIYMPCPGQVAALMAELLLEFGWSLSAVLRRPVLPIRLGPVSILQRRPVLFRRRLGVSTMSSWVDLEARRIVVLPLRAWILLQQRGDLLSGM